MDANPESITRSSDVIGHWGYGFRRSLRSAGMTLVVLGTCLNNLLSRAWALTAILALALIPAAAQAPRAAVDIQRIEIRAQAIQSFDPREPARTRFGALEFRGGLILESPNRDFGGFSGIRVMADGRLLSVTDKGSWLRGRIVYRYR